MSQWIEQRTRWMLGLVVAVALALGPTPAASQSARSGGADDSSTNGLGSDADVKVEGFLEAPPALTLPLPAGAPPVTALVSLGLPAIQVPFVITETTPVEVEDGLPPVTLVAGDRIEIEARLVGATFQATRVKIEDFPELELRGTAQGVPGAVALPLPPGVALDFTLVLGGSGLALPVRLTAAARLRDGSFVLQDGTLLEIEGVVRGFQIIIIETHRED
jgi:hypothetical protein